MTGTRWKWGTCIGVAALLLASGCSSNGGKSVSNGGMVKIGVIYPLSGPTSGPGVACLQGAELAVDLINNSYSDISLPFAATKGLPHLNGAKITLVSADTGSSPATAANEVDRFVSSDHVAAVMGAYESGVTLTASQRAERLQIPYLNADSADVTITQRGYKWLVRTGPIDPTYAKMYFDVLDTQKAAGRNVQRVAVLHFNDPVGNGAADATQKQAKARGYNFVANVAYEPDATSLDSQVQVIEQAHPDVLFVDTRTQQSIVLVKTLKRLGYLPSELLGYGSGFSDPAFLTAVGLGANGFVNRAAWVVNGSSGASKAVAALYEKKFGVAMDEDSARAFVGMMALAQAIDNAGSTQPEKIRSALTELNIPKEKTITAWGVKFDSTGQNVDATGVLQQVQDGKYLTVFPKEVATAKLIWPLSDAQK